VLQSIIREHLQSAKEGGGNQRFLRPAGALSGSGRPLFAQGLWAAMKGIADTGLIVAFGNRKDRHHEWAVGIAGGITEPLLTCEAVLAEAAFHLGSSGYVFGLLKDEMLRIAFEPNRNLEHLVDLARRYEDRKPDLWPISASSA
jgi:hypothetical protein